MQNTELGELKLQFSYIKITYYFYCNEQDKVCPNTHLLTIIWIHLALRVSWKIKTASSAIISHRCHTKSTPTPPPPPPPPPLTNITLLYPPLSTLKNEKTKKT